MGSQLYRRNNSTPTWAVAPRAARVGFLIKPGPGRTRTRTDQDQDQDQDDVRMALSTMQRVDFGKTMQQIKFPLTHRRTRLWLTT